MPVQWVSLLLVKLFLFIMSITPVCTSLTPTFAPCSDHWGLEENKVLSLGLAVTWALLEGGSIVSIGVPSMGHGLQRKPVVGPDVLTFLLECVCTRGK